MLTLDRINAACIEEVCGLLEGLYEHSPWVVREAASARPFASVTALKYALARAVRAAPRDAQLALIRAHPELAGKAAIAGQLTADSTHEQARAGLTACTPEEFATLQRLNHDYNARFGWPFILAVRGPRGLGLPRHEIIAAFARRLDNTPEAEFAQCLREIDRIAALRLDERLGVRPVQGEQVWDWAEALAAHSDAGFAERGELTVTYLTPAHRACAEQLAAWMRAVGFDEVEHDAVGNVVARYFGHDPQAPWLLTGSHFDTVRNGGKYDGRLGILVPMACVQTLVAAGRRLPYGIELVAFAEEEGQRYKATFLGSGALIGQFDPAWLDQADAQGVTMRAAMQAAGLPASLDAIGAVARTPSRYRGFVEVHIEQGPVLNELDMPLGVVNSINGSVRLLGELRGVASHAGTTPMDRRHDAVCAVAELALFVEQRAAADGDSVGTVGMLDVPNGSINVVPGRCRFSLDLRAPTDARRDALVNDVRAMIEALCQRRGVRCTLDETLRVSAAPSDAWLQSQWARAVAALGLPVHTMPSGAGHDAMKLHECMPQAMLFVRGGNDGISHNPLETITAHDAQLCVDAMLGLFEQLAR